MAATDKSSEQLVRTKSGYEGPLISRREARARGFIRYFTGKPCKHGHIADRRVSDCACNECSRAQYQREREHILAKMRDARNRNKSAQ